jgi:hypothetical protein
MHDVDYYLLNLLPEHEALPNREPMEPFFRTAWLLNSCLSIPTNLASGRSAGTHPSRCQSGAVSAALSISMHVPPEVIQQLQRCRGEGRGGRPCPVKPVHGTVVLVGLPLLKSSSLQRGKLALQRLQSTIRAHGGTLLHMYCGHQGTMCVATFGMASSLSPSAVEVWGTSPNTYMGTQCFTGEGDACRAAQVELCVRQLHIIYLYFCRRQLKRSIYVPN